MTTEAVFTISFKAGDMQNAPTVTIRADTQSAAATALEQVRDLLPLVSQVDAVAKGVSGVQQMAVTPQHTTTAAPASSPAPSTPAPQAQAAPAGAPELLHDGRNVTVMDRFKNEWEYNRPDAPITPRGPAVKGVKMSRAKPDKPSAPYTMWYDPAESEGWYPRPKPPQSELFERQFFND